MRRTSVVFILLACAALSASHAQVSVTGTGNVGVGSMSGGTINIGLTKAELEAALKARGAEQTRLMRKLADDLNAAAATLSSQSSTKPPADDFNATIVHGFLATVVGKKVPEGDWPRVFNELANQFFEAGSRIAATPVTSDAIKALVTAADAARIAGDYDKADAQLEMAEKQAIKDAADRKAQWRESNRQAASLLASRGSLALLRLERRKGAELLQRAFEQRADDVTSEVFGWLIEASDTWMIFGDSVSALRALVRARDAGLTKAAADPGNSQWQRNLSVSHQRIGNIEQARGNLAAALTSFQTGMVIAQKLAAADPGNSEWQRDLSVSHNKIGDIEQAQGNLAAALTSFKASIAIAQKLTAADPGNSQWQRDLSVSHDRIGAIEQAQGNLAAALTSFQAGMAIHRKLAAADPGNSQWQRDLSVNYDLIGKIERTQGNLPAALTSFQAGMATAQKLTAADPGNSEWQRDLSVSHDNIGDIEQAQGNLAAALTSFQAGMAIRRKLAAADPGNSQWQRDLSVSHNKIGDIEQAQGDLAAALTSFQAGMAIRRKLTAADPGNSEWQLDFVISCWKVGNPKGNFLKSGERRAILVRGLNTLEALEKQGRLALRAARWPTMFRKAITDLK